MDIKNIKSFEFAVRIVNLFKHLIEVKKEFIMSKQLMRSGTSVVQIFAKLNSPKVQTIFFINYVFQEKKQMKRCIG